MTKDLHMLPGPIETSPLGPLLAESVARAAVGSALHWAGPVAMAERSPRIGMIGTRQPASSSSRAIDVLAGLIVKDGGIIVSGGAIGTDLVAHLAALRGGGETIVAVPQGLGCLPTDWRSPLLKEGGGRLLLLSPFGVMQEPTRQTPVVRNRLIAALSEALVVGEAGMTSGTMHCLRAAREMGVPLFLLRCGEEAEPGVRNFQENMSDEGARIFEAAEADTVELKEEILTAATRRREELAAIREAQLRLF
ncbi:MAG: DNA-processing protein DprA [Candidatus Sumerlaeia bacterium]|nr:DNA-processing protein DprA [Candidatus Sumerlaeia bacterium]